MKEQSEKKVIKPAFRVDITGRHFCNQCEFECTHEEDAMMHYYDSHESNICTRGCIPHHDLHTEECIKGR